VAAFWNCRRPVKVLLVDLTIPLVLASWTARRDISRQTIGMNLGHAADHGDRIDDPCARRRAGVTDRSEG
jgi:hypothetical protein